VGKVEYIGRLRPGQPALAQPFGSRRDDAVGRWNAADRSRDPVETTIITGALTGIGRATAVACELLADALTVVESFRA
jgi:hypothetical protein